MRILGILVCFCGLLCFGRSQAADVLWTEKNPVKTSFDTNGWTFYKGAEGLIGDPAESFLKLVAVKGGEKKTLTDTASFKGYVSLKTPEDALAFVRLFTNLDTHYLFNDANWIEVVMTQQGEKRPIFGWVPPSKWETLGLFEPRASLSDDGFLVERCLLSSKKEIFSTEERVSKDGEYSMRVKAMLEQDSRAVYPVYQ